MTLTFDFTVRLFPPEREAKEGLHRKRKGLYWCPRRSGATRYCGVACLMHCPFCGSDESKVVDSRDSESGDTIRRRRECLDCERRYTTYERVEDVPLVVVKRERARRGVHAQQAAQRPSAGLREAADPAGAHRAHRRRDRGRAAARVGAEGDHGRGRRAGPALPARRWTRSPTCASPRSTSSSRTSTSSTRSWRGSERRRRPAARARSHCRAAMARRALLTHGRGRGDGSQRARRARGQDDEEKAVIELSANALKVLQRRYLKKGENGRAPGDPRRDVRAGRARHRPGGAPLQPRRAGRGVGAAPSTTSWPASSSCPTAPRS